MSYQCTYCWRGFVSGQALHAHCTDKSDHPYCEGCERLFTHDGALTQHLNTSPAHYDEDDVEEIYTSGTSGQGYRFYGEDYGEESSEAGSDEEESEEEALCVSCNRLFVNIQSLSLHLRDSAAHNWCFICSRDFRNPQALANHNSSPIHRIPTHRCPFCSKVHSVPSATAHHIESGCHGITRQQVTNAVHAMGVIPNISVARITGPSSSSVVLSYTADQSSFNGTKYVCFLCKRKFVSLQSLNQHLNSAAHDSAEFKCPKCKREYKVISGLIQHIESQACGVAKMKQVDNFAEGLVNQFSRLLKL